jgi:Mg/Co/Ni transporter MgtE
LPKRYLTGHLSLRSLVAANEEQTIGEIMNPHIISVHTNTHQKKVADLIQRYDFIALPVVDGENRLVGNAIDILEADTTKDIHTISGIQLVLCYLFCYGFRPCFDVYPFYYDHSRCFWCVDLFIVAQLVLKF